MNAFTHTPRDPHVTQTHPNHRWFTGLSESHWIAPKAQSKGFFSEEISVKRFADMDVAFLQFDVQTANTSSSFNVNLTAAELRELAQRLLDAAHDLEVNPAPQAELKNDGETA